MIVPDRVVQAERLVAVAPGVARTWVLFDDDRGHTELAQPSAERDAALAAADDEHVGLRLEAELLDFLVAQFLPGLGAGVDAMPGTERPVEAGLFLLALQLDHRRQQRPYLAVLQPDEPISARDLGLERDPGLGDAAGFGRGLPLGDFPVARLHAHEARAEHVADLVAAFHRLDVPGERDEVAPVAFRSERFHGGRRDRPPQARLRICREKPGRARQRWCRASFPPEGHFHFSEAQAYPNFRMNPDLRAVRFLGRHERRPPRPRGAADPEFIEACHFAGSGTSILEGYFRSP